MVEIPCSICDGNWHRNTDASVDNCDCVQLANTSESTIATVQGKFGRRLSLTLKAELPNLFPLQLVLASEWQGATSDLGQFRALSFLFGKVQYKTKTTLDTLHFE